MFVRSRQIRDRGVNASWAVLVALLLTSSQSANVHATGAQFLAPDGWSVGDLDSTFQEWDANIDFENPENAFSFSQSDTPPSDVNVNPALNPDSFSTMGVDLPGFVAGSGGYYAFGGPYTIYADVLNHGGLAGNGGPYESNFGTRVFVQTAATMSGGATVLDESMQLVQPDGSSITGGDSASALQAIELFVGDVDTPIGVLPQQELLYEFWLPGYTGDFRVEFGMMQSSSFQHLRIDTLIQKADALDPDFDANGAVEGNDFLTWQTDPEGYGGEVGLTAWQTGYGSSAGEIVAVPEPNSLALAALFAMGYLLRSRR